MSTPSTPRVGPRPGAPKPAPKPAPTARATAAPPALDDHRIGREARAADHDHLAVRTWLRLLSCSTQIEQAIRGRLRERFGTTLARFDYLAQLERHAEGLRMSALSRYLMVTGGNVTGLTTQLEAEGLVERQPDPGDGRSWRVRLTAAGRHQFSAMACEHEGWLRALFGGVADAELQQLYALLGHLRHTVATPGAAPEAPTPDRPHRRPAAQATAAPSASARLRRPRAG